MVACVTFILISACILNVTLRHLRSFEHACDQYETTKGLDDAEKILPKRELTKEEGDSTAAPLDSQNKEPLILDEDKNHIESAVEEI